MFTQNQECSLPIRAVLHGQRVRCHRRGHRGPGKPILCDSHVTSVPPASLHLITLVDTRAEPRGFEQVSRGKGPGAGMNEAAKLTCCITAGARGVLHCVPRISGKSIHGVQLLHGLHSCAWLRLALAVKGRGHLAPQKKQGAKSSQTLWSLFAFIPMSKEKCPKMGNNSPKTSFSMYDLQWVTDNSATAGNWIPESVLCIFPAIY